MIGGAMLTCAVAAMIIIAWWSLPRDDTEDPATGILALRTWSERVVTRKYNTANTRDRRPVPKKATAKRDRRPDPSKRRRLR